MKQISLKGGYVMQEAKLLKEKSCLGSTSGLIRGVILKINDVIVQKERMRMMYELKGITATVG